MIFHDSFWIKSIEESAVANYYWIVNESDIWLVFNFCKIDGCAIAIKDSVVFYVNEIRNLSLWQYLDYDSCALRSVNVIITDSNIGHVSSNVHSISWCHVDEIILYQCVWSGNWKFKCMLSANVLNDISISGTIDSYINCRPCYLAVMNCIVYDCIVIGCMDSILTTVSTIVSFIIASSQIIDIIADYLIEASFWINSPIH